MKEKIIGNLFFISLASFCIEGSLLITLIGIFVFCSCGIYIIRHQEDFLPEEEVISERKTARRKKRKKRYHNAA